jgi:hypothetical protein
MFQFKANSEIMNYLHVSFFCCKGKQHIAQPVPTQETATDTHMSGVEMLVNPFMATSSPSVGFIKISCNNK